MEENKDKRLKQLGGYAIGILVLAVIILVGSAILSGVSYSVRDAVTVNPASVTLGIAGTAAPITGYPYVTSMTGCVNLSGVFIGETNYSYTTNHATDYVTLLAAGGKFNGTSVNCSITYEKATVASNGADTFVTGLITFGTFISLIVLALVGKTIIKLFKEG
jgi:hypothetical protein